MRHPHMAVLLLLAACSNDHGVQELIYVSPTGSDAWPGTHERPFRTIDAARRAVRASNRSMTGDLVVRILPGDYVLTQGLELTAEDSGFNGYKVIYESAEGPETVRLLGGASITDWEPYAGPIMMARVAPGTTFHTLYEDGVRADEARYPNRATSPGLPTARGPYLTSVGVAGSHELLDYGLATVPDLRGELASVQVFVWSNAGHAWFTDVAPVAAVDPDAHQITLAEPTRYEIGAGSRFYVQGSLSLLDAPGEFFLDEASSTLYYWPRSGDASTSEIVAPMLTTLLSVRGATDLQFRGLRFEASDFPPAYRFGLVDGGFERQIEMPEHRVGMITLEDTERVDILFSHVIDAGYGGIYLLFHNERSQIYGNLIEHVGINGITLQGRYPGEGDVSHENVISNNLIHHVGEMAGNAAGIDLSNSGANALANNVIHDSPRFGIIVHAISGTSGDLLYAQDNVVSATEIANTCQDSGDAGALYTFGLSQDGTPLRQNTFRQILIGRAEADPSMMDLLPNGVFTDNDSGMQIFEDIGVSDVAGLPYRSNDPLPQRFTNVSWLPGFDARRLDPAAIGLRDDFPRAYVDEPSHRRPRRPRRARARTRGHRRRRSTDR